MVPGCSTLKPLVRHNHVLHSSVHFNDSVLFPGGCGVEKEHGGRHLSVANVLLDQL